ncbi:MAG: hypothetical protein U0R51_04795 [Solirubrobacterales bacterium]
MRKTLIAIAASLALASAVAPATATASGVSKVTISKVAPYWHGMVMSTRFGGTRSCEQKRLVKVFKQRDGKDLLIGKDTSSKKGHWLVPGEATKGSYYAILPARPAGKKPACLEDHSSVVDVG